MKKNGILNGQFGKTKELQDISRENKKLTKNEKKLLTKRKKFDILETQLAKREQQEQIRSLKTEQNVNLSS